MDMALKIEDKYTIKDIYALPEGQRAELINGQMYLMATPKTIHQRYVMELSATIRNYIRSIHGDCEVFPAPFAVFLNADDKIYLEPDISVICNKSKIDEEGCKGAPDWIVEVVSQGNSSHDYVRKLNLYMNFDVREYWIVDPDKERIMVWNFTKETLDEYTLKDTVKAGIYEDFEIDFSQLNIP